MMRRTPDEEWGIAGLPIKKVKIPLVFNADVLRVAKKVLAWMRKAARRKDW